MKEEVCVEGENFECNLEGLEVKEKKIFKNCVFKFSGCSFGIIIEDGRAEFVDCKFLAEDCRKLIVVCGGNLILQNCSLNGALTDLELRNGTAIVEDCTFKSLYGCIVQICCNLKANRCSFRNAYCGISSLCCKEVFVSDCDFGGSIFGCSALSSRLSFKGIIGFNV